MKTSQHNVQPRKRSIVYLIWVLVGLTCLCWTPIVFGKDINLVKGQSIPMVNLVGKDGEPVSLNTLKRQVTLVSIVPQLNTPVCDEQTHRFSEQNDGLDEFVQMVTISTNTHTDQRKFSHDANIHNMTFLSDAPDFQFGRQTGLLLKEIDILHRAVIVLDEDLIIRYVEIVPMSQLPNFDNAFQAARRLLPRSS